MEARTPTNTSSKTSGTATRIIPFVDIFSDSGFISCECLDSGAKNGDVCYSLLPDFRATRLTWHQVYAMCAILKRRVRLKIYDVDIGRVKGVFAGAKKQTKSRSVRLCACNYWSFNRVQLPLGKSRHSTWLEIGLGIAKTRPISSILLRHRQQCGWRRINP